MYNEASIIREWMEAHLREGIEHFFIIDHQSTDNWRNRVSDLIERGLVTSVYATGPNVDDVRAEHAAQALAACEWLLVVDLDEFTYARGSATVAECLRALPPDVAQVKIPWLMFGSSGNASQPRSVVKACQRREDIVDLRGCWLAKSAIRPSKLLMLKIHCHWVRGSTVMPLPAWPEIDDSPYLPRELLGRESEMLLVLNHYNLQSREHFEEKAKRDGYGSTKKYTEAYFAKTEATNNAVADDRLFVKHADLFNRIDEGA
jgi:hypothetical protein